MLLLQLFVAGLMDLFEFSIGLDFEIDVVGSLLDSNKSAAILVVAFDVLAIIIGVTSQRSILPCFLFLGHEVFDIVVPGQFYKFIFLVPSLVEVVRNQLVLPLSEIEVDVDVDRTLLGDLELKNEVFIGFITDSVGIVEDYVLALWFRILWHYVEFGEQLVDFSLSSQELAVGMRDIYALAELIVLLLVDFAVCQEGELALPVAGQKTLHLIHVVLEIDPIGCAVGYQTYILEFKVAAGLPHHYKARLIERDSLHFDLFGGLLQLRVLDVADVLFQVKESVPRKAEGFNKLKGLCRFHVFNLLFLFQPGLHEDDLPGLFNPQPPVLPQRLVGLLVKRDLIIDELYVVLAIPPDEVLIKALLVDFLGEKQGLQVGLVDHAELCEEAGEGAFMIGFEGQILHQLGRKYLKLLLVERVYPLHFCILYGLLFVGEGFIDFLDMLREEVGLAVGAGAGEGAVVDGGFFCVRDGIVVFVVADAVDFVGVVGFVFLRHQSIKLCIEKLFELYLCYAAKVGRNPVSLVQVID